MLLRCSVRSATYFTAGRHFCSASAGAAATSATSVGIIGVGQMGTAMLKAFVDTGSMGRITASDVDPAALQKVEGLVGAAATCTLDNSEVALVHDVLVVATEPDDVAHVLAEIYPVLCQKVRPSDHMTNTHARARAHTHLPPLLSHTRVCVWCAL